MPLTAIVHQAFAGEPLRMYAGFSQKGSIPFWLACFGELAGGREKPRQLKHRYRVPLFQWLNSITWDTRSTINAYRSPAM